MNHRRMVVVVTVLVALSDAIVTELTGSHSDYADDLGLGELEARLLAGRIVFRAFRRLGQDSMHSTAPYESLY